MRLLDLIVLAPFPTRIKVLQRKAIGIDALVAGVAGLVAFVLIYLLLERLCLSVFRFQHWDTLRRWRERRAHNIF